MANRHSPRKRTLIGPENHEVDDYEDPDYGHHGSKRFENRIFGLVFVAPLVLIFAAMESAIAFSWSPLILGSVASVGLLAVANVSRRIRLQDFKNAWIFLNIATALFFGLAFLGANAVVTGTNPVFPGYMSFPLRYNYSVSSCLATYLFRAPCLSYDPLLILLEYLYWTLVAVGLVSVVDLATRFTARVRNQTV